MSLGITGICKECKEPFEKKRRKQDFCRKDCKDKFHNRLKRTCPHCGKQLIEERTPV